MLPRISEGSASNRSPLVHRNLRPEIGSGARHSRRIEVGGRQQHRRYEAGQCQTERAGAAAEVDDDRPRTCQPSCFSYQMLGAVAGDEDPGSDGHPYAAELGVADDELERFAGDPTGDERLQLGRGAGSGSQHRSLVLGEDATAGPQSLDDLGQRRWHGCEL